MRLFCIATLLFGPFFPLLFVEASFQASSLSSGRHGLGLEKHREAALRTSTSSSYDDSPSSPSNMDSLMLVQPTVQINPAGAARAMAAAEAEAEQNGWAVTICICDAGGTPIMVTRKAFAASYDIAVGKAKSAALFGKETAGLEASVNVSNGSSRTALLSAPFVLMRGGVPFMVHGLCCGAVGVSGVQAEQDEKVARAAVTALTSAIATSKL